MDGGTGGEGVVTHLSHGSFAEEHELAVARPDGRRRLLGLGSCHGSVGNEDVFECGLWDRETGYGARETTAMSNGDRGPQETRR